MLLKRRGGGGFTGCCSWQNGKDFECILLAYANLISAYALQRHRPLTLQATITLPTPNEDPTELAPPLTGFIHLVSLFRPFDDMFISLWNKARSDYSPAYLSALQKQLTEALPAYLNSTESQAADLRTSQQWLRTMVWQPSIQNGCLSSGSVDPSMTFQYPVEIASQFSHQSMEVHGISLVSGPSRLVSVTAFIDSLCQVEKLFDIACSLTDVLSLLPNPADPFVLGPRDYLTQFLTLLSTLRNGDSRFLPLLLSKVHDVLPRLASPMLQTVPENANNCVLDHNIDIFDGFGNAGMGVPSSLSVQFDKHIEDVTSDNSQGCDNTPFTSPPIIQNPMEYPGLDHYNGFPGLSVAMNGQGHGQQIPTMQNSMSNGFAVVGNIPEFRHLQREDNGMDDFGMGVGKWTCLSGDLQR